MHSTSGCHGEYKVPGGKLIAADLVVSGEQLCAVELSGDFFLDPEETLERMVAAVEGISAGTPSHELLVRLLAVTEGAKLLGVTPEGMYSPHDTVPRYMKARGPLASEKESLLA